MEITPDNSPLLKIRKTNSILHIELNRPKTLNALTTNLLKALLECLEKGEKDEEVQAVFLTGGGNAFCAGQNLQEVFAENAPPVRTILEDFYFPVITCIRDLPKPIVCGVNGLTVGAGVSLALACDLILVAKSAKFLLGFSKVGLIPDAGATYFLLKALGTHRSAKMIYMDKPILAGESVDLGLSAKMFDDDTFAESCSGFMQEFRGQSLCAFAEGKKLLNFALHNDLKMQMAEETNAQSRLSLSKDHQDRVNAFLTKKNKK